MFILRSIKTINICVTFISEILESGNSLIQLTVLGIPESHNVTVYLDPGQSKTNYTLPGCPYTAAYLSEGSYIFYGHCSVYNINVLSTSYF